MEENGENCRVLKIENPILTNTDLLKIKNISAKGFQVAVIPITYYKSTPLERAIDHVYVEVERATKKEPAF